MEIPNKEMGESMKKEKKQEEIIEKPQKGFEEFSIDPETLNELDALPEEKLNTEEATNQATSEVEVIDEPKNEMIDASSVEFINLVKENINSCAKEIKKISETMDKIEAQKGSEAFWKKGENIRTISKNVNKMSEVQQKTLDLLVLFLGSSNKMADDYDTILKTIDELGEVNGGEAEVLDYLLKIKRMVKEIKSNDERLKLISFECEQAKKQIEQLDKNYKEKTDNYEKNSKISVSKIRRLQGRCNRQSFFILLSYILIIIIGVVIYLNLFN